MIPAVTIPRSAGIRRPVEIKLKPKYWYDSRKRIFASASGKQFKPFAALPKNTRIVYKVPALAERDPATITKHERDLQRYMQIILPQGESPADYIETIRTWPSVEDVWLAPEFSLPMSH